jgi:DNA-binding MarR family transcriptional regulator
MRNIKESEQLLNNMIQLGKFISGHTQESFEEKTATMLQFSALHFIKEQPKSTVSDLATQLKLSKSSATQLVERLEKSENIKKIEDRKDKRIIRLKISLKGEEEFKNLRKKKMEKIDALFSKMPKSDIKELIRIQNTLIRTLEGEK